MSVTRAGTKDREDDVVVYYYSREDAEADYKVFYGPDTVKEYPPHIQRSNEKKGLWYIVYPK